MEFSDAERLQHIHIIGGTGVGKTTLLQNLALADIKARRPLIFIDPHGDAVNELADSIPSAMIEQTCFLDLTDRKYAVAFNPLAHIPLQQRAVAAAGLVSGMKSIF